MEFIAPSFEIWEQNNSIDGIWAHIARCTRICYQSTPKENGETNEEFVKRVILRNGEEKDFEKLHGAMLEHGTVYLAIPYTDSETLSHYIGYAGKYNEIEFTKYSKVTMTRSTHNYVTTNLRVIYENDWLDDLKYICSPTEHHIKRLTVSFTTNIGVTREFNRHRVNSIAEESTRYCNYSKKNDGQLKIGLPAWLLDDEHLPYLEGHAFDKVGDYASGIIWQEDDEIVNNWCDMDFYLCALTFSQWCYNMLIAKGWKPQQAREVLPLATKSQLIHTAFVDDWKHFFKLRADGVSGPPHPNAALLAKPLKDKFIELGYINGN